MSESDQYKRYSIVERIKDCQKIMNASAFSMCETIHLCEGFKEWYEIEFNHKWYVPKAIITAHRDHMRRAWIASRRNK